MRNFITKIYSIAFVAALFATLSLGVENVGAESNARARGIIAKANSGQKERRPQIPRSDVKCGQSQIPVYDAEKISCFTPPLPPVDQLPGPNNYEIVPEGIIEGDIWGLEHVYFIQGGHLNTRTGEGEILLQGGQIATITFAYKDAEILALTVKFGIYGAAPTEYSGVLQASAPGSNIYDGDLIDVFGNGWTFDLPGIRLIQP